MPRRNTQQRLNWDGIDFCDPQTISYEKIVNILVGKDKVFPSSLGGIFLNRYKKMQENFSKPISSEDDKGRNIWYQDEDGLGIANAEKFKDALLEIGRDKFNGDSKWVGSDGILNYPCVGHDLPIWICTKNGNDKKKRIMIVSQDPMRNCHGCDKLLLSSPYGFHSADYLNSAKRNDNMLNLVHWLLYVYDAYVYLTDFKKIYIRSKKDSGSKGLCVGEPKNGGCEFSNVCSEQQRAKSIIAKKSAIDDHYLNSYSNALREEVTLFKPDLILTLGAPASKSLNEDLKDENFSTMMRCSDYRGEGKYYGEQGELYTTLSFLHLSGSNAKAFGKAMGKGGSGAAMAYLEFVKNTVSQLRTNG